MTFKELGVREDILRAVEELGFEYPMPVQEKVIPHLLCEDSDVVALAHTCPRPLAAVFKKELANVPLLKQIIACTKSFAMDREDVRQSLTVIQNVTEEVKKGRAYVIFPEGTRSKTGNQMRDFHAGSFRAAIKGKVNVLPVAFIDCYKVLDQKGSKPLTVQIHYLPPITPEEYAGMKAADLAALVQGRIEECITANTR